MGGGALELLQSKVGVEFIRTCGGERYGARPAFPKKRSCNTRNPGLLSITPKYTHGRDLLTQ